MSSMSKEKIIKGIKDILRNYWYAFNENDQVKMAQYRRAAMDYKESYDIDNILSQEEFEELMQYKERVKHGRK